MKGIGEEQNPGWVLKTREVFMPKGLKAILEAIKEILQKGKVQSVLLEIGRPITYTQMVQETNEPLAEVGGMTLGDVSRNVQMEEYSPAANLEDNLLAWHRMWLSIALRGLYVTHIGVGAQTRLFNWLGLDPMVYGGLTQMYGADVVVDKEFTSDIIVLFAGPQVGGRVENITFAMKCHLLTEDDLAQEDLNGPGLEGKAAGGGNHSGERRKADGTVANTAGGKSQSIGEVRPRKNRPPQG